MPPAPRASIIVPPKNNYGPPKSGAAESIWKSSNICWFSPPFNPTSPLNALLEKNYT